MKTIPFIGYLLGAVPDPRKKAKAKHPKAKTHRPLKLKGVPVVKAADASLGGVTRTARTRSVKRSKIL